ncbi:MAG TPA: hypothetical protein EYP69_03625 [Bacteroidales bacterium]|nr:hypothetical protein [Bacteroidales bacterium]
MNYISLIISKLTLVIGFIFLHNIIQAQFSSSPYSIYGLGDRLYPYSTSASGMGYAAIALDSRSFINVINPASYATRDSLNFIFDITINNRYNHFKTETASGSDLQTHTNQILLGFRLNKWWGTTIGLIPFSSCGYAIESEKNEPNIGNVSYYFKGDGGLNQFFIGNGFALHKNISIGINASFVYGYLDHFNSAILPSSNYFYSSLRNRLVVNDFYFNYGLNYHKKINENTRFTIGLIFDNEQKLQAKDSYLATKSIFLNSTIIDTITYSENQGKLISMPMRYGFGFSLERKKWLWAGDYSFTEWSKMMINDDNAKLVDESQFHLGARIKPDHNAYGHYFKRVAYRMGVYFNYTNLQINNNQLKQYGVTLGMGLPLRKTKTTINFSLDIGKRGTIDNNLIEEFYGLLRINLNLHDIWFVKSKFE